MSQQKLNAPCFVILGSEEEGTILARSYETLDFQDKVRLSDPGKYYIAQTNMDVWKSDVTDPRYELVKQQMAALTEINESTLVRDVLDYPGVRTQLTIFSAGMSPKH